MGTMKKLLMLLAVMLPLVFCCGMAQAADAADITESCQFKASNSYYKYTMMYDRKYTSHWRVQKAQKHPWISIDAPDATPIHGLYICFAQMPESYELQVRRGGDWVTYCEGPTDYYHAYIAIPEGADAIRIYVTQNGAFQLDVNELFVLGEGDVPSWVQRWEPTPEDADLLLVSTHPDDDLIFFCGAIPTYAVDRGYSVAVCYYTYSNTTRRSELLNALWSMGYHQYPIIGTFPDKSQKKVDDCYKTAGGESKVLSFFTEVIQQVKPKVVVSHDVEGEYGHGQHKMVADALQKVYDLAATGENAWQVQKLYLHLWPENQITVDWDVPLGAYYGQTGRDLAIQAFTYHVTQDGTKYDVVNTGAEYDNECFGLVRTEVGPDVQKDDFLENIGTPRPTLEPGMTPTPAPTPIPTAEPAYLSEMPELNEKGFLDAGEYVLADDTEGQYIFINETVKVVIQRKYDGGQNLTWYDAEIWCDTGAGEYLKTYPYNPNKLSETADIEDTAKKNQLVFAMNTDYYIYRRGSTRPMGLIIRDGQILYEKPYKSYTTKFPNLDTLAFYPDGTMEANASCEVTGEEYLARGAVNVYSFGPILLQDGAVTEWVLNRADSQQPRCAVGYIEPGHYVCILCEGRLTRSDGVTLNSLALMMKSRGCSLAFNLDGGQTAAMTFMGQRINEIGRYESNGKMTTNPRKTTEVMGIGISDQVGHVEFQ